MFGRNEEKSVDELREELIEDTYAFAFGTGFHAALLEVPDIENMSDDEIITEAKDRGLI